MWRCSHVALFLRTRSSLYSGLSVPHTNGNLAGTHAGVDFYSRRHQHPHIWMYGLVWAHPACCLPHGPRPLRRIPATKVASMEKKKICMINLERLIDALSALFAMRSYRIVVGQKQDLWTLRRLLAPDALLPVIVRMAEEQWTSASGPANFGLSIDYEDDALCGHVLNAVHYAPICIIVLCVDHVFQQLVDQEGAVTIEAMEAYARKLCPMPYSQVVPS